MGLDGPRCPFVGFVATVLHALAACLISTGRGTRRVHLVREGGGGGGAACTLRSAAMRTWSDGSASVGSGPSVTRIGFTPATSTPSETKM